MIKITVDLEYHREEFDDWLAAGKVEYERRIYHWSAQNNNYGFGWEIQPLSEKDWSKITDGEFNRIIALIESCCCKHQAEYVF